MAQLKTIKRGSKGPLVELWQTFLLGDGSYRGHVDGDFGPMTEDSTKSFQKANFLDEDGVVGNATWGEAMTLGLEVVLDTSTSLGSPNWPPKPDDLKPTNMASRFEMFGKFDYKPAPTKSNPEGIKILGNWQKENLCRVTVPQLKGIYGAPGSGRVFWHKAARKQLLGLFKAWEDTGLIWLVQSWAGSWNPRFIRGSRTVLSNHAMATAFDLNVAWNGLGRRPALVNFPGSVRELVPLANEFGFYWGGHFGPAYNNGKGRADGMHFEVAKILP